MGLTVHKRLLDRLEGEGRNGGFTLIELLIVIVVIGILAGIAIFAFNPFQQSAEAACDRANERIASGVDAATAASEELGLSLTQDDFVEGTYADLTDCDFVAGPGGPGGGSFTATQVQQADGGGATDNEATVTLGSQPQEGHTLIAIATHRTTVETSGGVSIDGSDWSLAGYEYQATGTSDRRGLAVWTKTAGAGEPDTITVTTSPTDGSGDVTLIVREFDQDLSVVASDTNNSGPDEVTSLSTGSVSGSAGSALIVTGVGMRDGTDDVSWSSVVGNNIGVSEDTSTASGYASVADGSETWESEASWTGAEYANAFILLLQ